MSTVHQDSDSQPCVAPVARSKFHRIFGALSFPGGPAALVGMPESHMGGFTPTTITSTGIVVAQDRAITDAILRLENAEALAGESRKAELLIAQKAIEEALLWCD